MNINVKVATVAKADMSSAEWEARVDLAAAYRLIAHYGWGDVIYNHSSMRCPARSGTSLSSAMSCSTKR